MICIGRAPFRRGNIALHRKFSPKLPTATAKQLNFRPVNKSNVFTFPRLPRGSAHENSVLRCKRMKTGGVYLGFDTSGGRKFPHGNFRTTRVLRSSEHRLSEKRSFSTALVDLVAAENLDIGKLLVELIEQAAHGMVVDVAGEVDVEYIAPRASLSGREWISVMSMP